MNRRGPLAGLRVLEIEAIGPVVLQPAPAPRFSRTPGAIAGPPVSRGQGGDAALAEWGAD